ncbi:hypothetical protein BDV59DRAFT_203130 [Aspergillus ambiguus]|uniref:uncharacterized protein n=1 Tax=Aspergillus ambiguus TaxID=176160 RepID=UPI003CCE11A8
MDQPQAEEDHDPHTRLAMLHNSLLEMDHLLDDTIERTERTLKRIDSGEITLPSDQRAMIDEYLREKREEALLLKRAIAEEHQRFLATQGYGHMSLPTLIKTFALFVIHLLVNWWRETVYRT